jgi:hypothetical protein
MGQKCLIISKEMFLQTINFLVQALGGAARLGDVGLRRYDGPAGQGRLLEV